MTDVAINIPDADSISVDVIEKAAAVADIQEQPVDVSLQAPTTVIVTMAGEEPIEVSIENLQQVVVGINDLPAIDVEILSGVGPAGPTLPRIEISITASEPIAIGDPVTITGYVGDSSDVTHAGKIAGIAITTAEPGFSAKVATEGEVTNSAWNWTAGDIIYLNGKALSVTPPAAGFLQEIGEAKNNHVIYVNVQSSIIY